MGLIVSVRASHIVAFWMQNGDTLEHMMLWIQEEPVKGGILFVVSSVKSLPHIFPVPAPC